MCIALALYLFVSDFNPRLNLKYLLYLYCIHFFLIFPSNLFHIIIDCNITCSTEGYYVNLNVCRCEIDDICVVNSPCKNSGTCLPGSLPKQYQCICTDDYMNENCTGKTSCFTENT